MTVFYNNSLTSLLCAISENSINIMKSDIRFTLPSSLNAKYKFAGMFPLYYYLHTTVSDSSTGDL